MDHIISKSSTCEGCKKRHQERPDLPNKFCKKGKCRFEINNAFYYNYPDKTLLHRLNTLKKYLTEMNEKKIKYEKYYSWFETDLKEKEIEYKRKFDNKRKSVINQYKKECNEKDQIDDDVIESKRQKR